MCSWTGPGHAHGLGHAKALAWAGHSPQLRIQPKPKRATKSSLASSLLGSN